VLALFISNPKSAEAQLLQQQIPEMKEAMEVLAMLSHDKKSREIYEDRMKAQRDKDSNATSCLGRRHATR
jgi:hypothetical protein